MGKGIDCDSRDMFQFIFNNAPYGICLFEITEDGMPGRFIEVNDVISKRSGYNRGELLKMSPLDLIASEYLNEISKAIKALSRKEQTTFEFDVVTKDGIRIPLEATCRIFSLKDKKVILSAIRDISKQKKLENELNFQYMQLLNIFNSVDEVIYVSDPVNYEILYINEILKRIFGDVVGEKCYKAFQNLNSPCPFCTNEKIFGDNLGKSYIWEFKNKVTGRWYRCIDKAIKWPDGRFVRCEIAIDIDDRIKAEEEKVKLEKEFLKVQHIEAIGRIVASVAHELNNIFTAINGYCQLAMMEISEESSVFDDLNQIQIASEKAANIVRQLLIFTKKETSLFTELNLNSLIESLGGILKHITGEDISIQTELEPKLWRIMGNWRDIEQLLVNLIMNARDAIQGAGRITIKTENVTVDKAGKFVCLSIADTGTGMDEEIIKYIFDPFFTTKKLGKSKGLGLSVAYIIAKHHKGWIDVQSKPGEGAIFRIFIPAYFGEVKDEIEKPSPLDVSGKRILLVEDEELVRAITVKVLKENGYIVFEAEDAEEAIELFDRENGNFDLVITDVVLPGKDGIQLVERFLKCNPRLKTLLISGYTDKKLQLPIIKEKKYNFLEKPYTINKLLETIDNLSGGGGGKKKH